MWPAALTVLIFKKALIFFLRLVLHVAARGKGNRLEMEKLVRKNS